jgi:hypothetical protein
MAQLLDRCSFTPTAGTTADFVVSAATPGFMAPATAGAVDGVVYSFFAQSSDLSQWEIGRYTWNLSGTKMVRTTIIASSNSGSKVNFSAAPTVSCDALAEDLGRNVCRMRRTTAFSHAYASVPAAISLGTVDIDTNGSMGNGTNGYITIKVAGIYQITGTVYYSGQTAGDALRVWIYINGAAYASASIPAEVNGDGSISVTCLYSGAVSDIIALYGDAQTSASITTATSTGLMPVLEVSQVA